MFPVLVDPPVVDQPDRHCIQEMQLFSACATRDDKAGLLQNLEVLHDTEARHLEPGLELLQRLSITLEEQIQEETTRRVSERLEYVVVIRHEEDNK